MFKGFYLFMKELNSHHVN